MLVRAGEWILGEYLWVTGRGMSFFCAIVFLFRFFIFDFRGDNRSRIFVSFLEVGVVGRY